MVQEGLGRKTGGQKDEAGGEARRCPFARSRSPRKTSELSYLQGAGLGAAQTVGQRQRFGQAQLVVLLLVQQQRQVVLEPRIGAAQTAPTKVALSENRTKYLLILAQL